MHEAKGRKIPFPGLRRQGRGSSKPWAGLGGRGERHGGGGKRQGQRNNGSRCGSGCHRFGAQKWQVSPACPASSSAALLLLAAFPCTLPLSIYPSLPSSSPPIPPTLPTFLPCTTPFPPPPLRKRRDLTIRNLLWVPDRAARVHVLTNTIYSAQCWSHAAARYAMPLQCF